MQEWFSIFKLNKMKQSKLNLVIDAIMLIVMMAIIGIGLLVKYVLLTGQEKWDKFGENYEFTLMGLDRHDWGQIHFILGIVLFGLLVLHILLHWKTIVSIYKNLIESRPLRIFIAWVLLVISISLIVFSFLINPSIEDPIYNDRNHYPEINRGTESQTSTQHTSDKHYNIPSNIEVLGSMTLFDVSRKYQVPTSHLKKELNISISTSDYERLGRLRRTKDFTMSKVEEIIYTYQKQNK